MNDDLVLVRLDPARHMARFYRVVVEQTLFGDIVTRRIWGRLGQGGRELTEHYLTRGEAEVAGVAHLARKLRRGYRPYSCWSNVREKPTRQPSATRCDCRSANTRATVDDVARVTGLSRLPVRPGGPPRPG